MQNLIHEFKNHMLSKMCQKNYSQQNQHAPAFVELIRCQYNKQQDPGHLS